MTINWGMVLSIGVYSAFVFWLGVFFTALIIKKELERKK